MKFVLAPDSFKESMPANEVCQAMASGIRQVMPDAKIISVPMADGGEGTTSSLVDSRKGQYIKKQVTGPLGKKVTACYGLIDHGKTAIIEMAQASGLNYVPFEKRNPISIKRATTYGVGELIIDALDHGVKKIILGLGGSGTNDGGSGMAQAIGVDFFDQKQQKIQKKLGGGQLNDIERIDLSHIDPRIQNTEFILASDVTSPLIGADGASYTFGQQKGADAPTQKQLDCNLQHYAEVIQKCFKKNIAHIPGSGAAGGLGAGLLAFTPAKIMPGVQVVAKENKLEAKIKDADYVFTGEGGTDFQTKFGKTPYGVAQIAQKNNVPVISLAGYLGDGIDQLYGCGFTAIFGILAKASSLDEALKDGPTNVVRTTENIVRLIAIKK